MKLRLPCSHRSIMTRGSWGRRHGDVVGVAGGTLWRRRRSYVVIVVTAARRDNLAA